MSTCKALLFWMTGICSAFSLQADILDDLGVYENFPGEESAPNEQEFSLSLNGGLSQVEFGAHWHSLVSRIDRAYFLSGLSLGYFTKYKDQAQLSQTSVEVPITLTTRVLSLLQPFVETGLGLRKATLNFEDRAKIESASLVHSFYRLGFHLFLADSISLSVMRKAHFVLNQKQDESSMLREMAFKKQLVEYQFNYFF